MDNKLTQEFLQSSLFWDVDKDHLDINIHARFITERVLNRGGTNDWKMLLNLYGAEKVREEAVTIRSLDPKTLNYLSVFFNIAKTDFRCCS